MSRYDGHEDSCDCAVCENMYLRELHLKRVEADLEAMKQLVFQMGFDAAKRKAVEAIGCMPTRVEPISGQNFTYVQQAEAIDTIRDLVI